ncbi:hypothetical protein [Luteococcus japonicus]|uniref:hypothetical protein n=1 Tax=Luteococcus japonicus TaxID=33984 RepID=UPI000B9AC0BA|nr:hypothetical protein [Luteococcus japonicus]
MVAVVSDVPSVEPALALPDSAGVCESFGVLEDWTEAGPPEGVGAALVSCPDAHAVKLMQENAMASFLICETFMVCPLVV